MLANRHIARWVAAVTALAVCALLCAAACGDTLRALAGSGVTMDYATALFDTDAVLEINIQMDEDDWDAMLENAMAEEYSSCDVQIGGQTFYRVGIRPKGNTSLSAIANDPTTDRYSFKLEFDHYVDGQTCFGLDKLILNNNYADATGMKEALIYDLFQTLGADASLYTYAKLSVNGEYRGVYLALEAVEDSFLLRNYGVQNGALYKPEGMNMGGGQMPQPDGMPELPTDFDPTQFENWSDTAQTWPETENAPNAPNAAEAQNAPDAQNTPGEQNAPDAQNAQQADAPRDRRGQGEDGGFSMSSGGADLKYSDDALDSYSTIWDGAVTDTTDADHRRVVTALENIADGTDLQTYLDTDNLLRYMAVHIFSVNEDSLSGSMAHNYYLYESGGRLNLLPWDYNLSFGGMGMGSDATDVVNSAIDDAFRATTFFDTLMADETAHAQYYEWMRQIVAYVEDGGFDAFYTRVRGQIDELVATDPTAFYSYDEYVTAAENFAQLIRLRAESIAKQLDGEIPSTESGRSSADALVRADELDLSTLGGMNTGGHGGDRAQRGEEFRENGEAPAQAAFADTDLPQRPDNAQSDRADDAAAFDPTQMGGGFPGRDDGTAERDSRVQTACLYGICLLVLAAALGFVCRFRRRPRKP